MCGNGSYTNISQLATANVRKSNSLSLKWLTILFPTTLVKRTHFCTTLYLCRKTHGKWNRKHIMQQAMPNKGSPSSHNGTTAVAKLHTSLPNNAFTPNITRLSALVDRGADIFSLEVAGSSPHPSSELPMNNLGGIHSPPGVI